MQGEGPRAATSPASAEAMRALGAQLCGDDLIIVPVRHHSPGCAWQLRRLFAQCTPSAVLVEGPRSFTTLAPLLAAAEAKMPLAIYTYAVQRCSGEESEQRRAAYYPFCDYSPELVALREAQQRGIAARFIDLDFTEQCALEPDGDDEADSLLAERYYRRSRYLEQLAHDLGCRDHEELWEHLFEVDASERDLCEYITQIAAYCHLARSECSAEELNADGTLQREAEMAWHIRQALAERTAGAGPVLAIMGGFHAVVMPALLAAPVTRPAIACGEISDTASALIRYSFDRLDRLNGYAAGMTSPAWHQQLWERTLQYDRAGQGGSSRIRREAALSVLLSIAQELRERHDLALPVPALTAAYEQTLRLAALRRRRAPVRDDVLDAVTSCFVKGDADADGALVLAVARRTLSGQQLGSVPAGAGAVPLVKDFAYRARRQRLKIDSGEPRRAVLDIYRRSEHCVTSRLLHGLFFLGIPFGLRSAGPDFVAGVGLDRLQEHWEYLYSAATEAALVEASVYGTTIAQAVANRFAARIDQFDSSGNTSDARVAAQWLVQACVLGVHDHVPRVIAALRAAIGADAAFVSVSAAAASVGLLWESREPLEARAVTELPEVLQAAYERAIYLGGQLQGGEAEAAVAALTQLRELLISAAGRALDAALYWSLLQDLRQHSHALIRGAAAGLLYTAGRLPDTELSAAIAGHLNGLGQPHEAVGFLRGLLQTARETAWQQPLVLDVLDTLLRQWDEAVFVALLPELRLAFAAMTPKETDRIAAAVAQLHGVADIGPLVQRDLDAAQVQRHLEISRELQEVLAADGLVEWLTA